MHERYIDQVRLLLSVLPDIAAEEVFALKGGTAINPVLQGHAPALCRHRSHLPAGGRPRDITPRYRRDA